MAVHVPWVDSAQREGAREAKSGREPGRRASCGLRAWAERSQSAEKNVASATSRGSNCLIRPRPPSISTQRRAQKIAADLALAAEHDQGALVLRLLLPLPCLAGHRKRSTPPQRLPLVFNRVEGGLIDLLVVVSRCGLGRGLRGCG